jgi:Flp pilus assembly protein TadD
MKHIILVLFSGILFAQKTDKMVAEGNQKFEEKKFSTAETDYRIAQSKTEKNSVATYNLGNSIYKQKQTGEARIAYAKTVQTSKDKAEKHKAFHNMGNTYMIEKDYQNAVEAYKNALRNNPNDEESRYNYALAKKMLKENPPKDDKSKDEKNQDDKKQQQNQDKQKDKQDKQDNQHNQQNNNNQKDKQDKQQEQQPQPKPSGNSKQLLEAVNNAEKQIQDKVNARKVKGSPVENEKDW